MSACFSAKGDGGLSTRSVRSAISTGQWAAWATRPIALIMSVGRGDPKLSYTFL